MDILKKFKVSYFPSGKEAVELVFCFDNGLPYTFIKKSSAEKVGKVFELAEPRIFAGLGEGKFESKQIIHLYIRVLEFWCSHVAYVVQDNLLEQNYDLLVGHDFRQLYGINLVPHKGEIEIDEDRLRLAQKVRHIHQDNKSTPPDCG